MSLLLLLGPYTTGMVSTNVCWTVMTPPSGNWFPYTYDYKHLWSDYATVAWGAL